MSWFWSPENVSSCRAAWNNRTCADEEAAILCFEPAGTRNTGNVQDTTYSAPNGVAI
ncbi:MAG TPA: hypothetical protein VER26_14330 [Xanthobacteraceae bacterium]|jgi:hypothetical protein|nr:hypothetical protein [Xanthobacteraceae bacterium]